MKTAVSTAQAEKRIATETQPVNNVYGNRCLLPSYIILQHVVHTVTTGIQTAKERKLRITVDTIMGALSGFEQSTA
jgi:hypothetical protein